MGKPPGFDVAAAHRYFAAHCFNAAWKLIDKADRSTEEERQMIALNQASIWHWTQRPDCDAEKLSIGYWQAARIHALLGLADEARRYAEICLGFSAQLKPFYRAYAHEALARAARLKGDSAAVERHAGQARALAEQVGDAKSRKQLLSDLASVA